MSGKALNTGVKYGTCLSINLAILVAPGKNNDYINTNN